MHAQLQAGIADTARHSRAEISSRRQAGALGRALARALRWFSVLNFLLALFTGSATGQGTVFAVATGLSNVGASGWRKLCVTDWDGDGRFDLLLNSANANLLRQVNALDGKWFFQDERALNKQNIEGHDVNPAVVDLDGGRRSRFSRRRGGRSLLLDGQSASPIG